MLSMDETARLNDQLRHTFYQGGHVEYSDRIMAEISLTALSGVNFYIRNAEVFDADFASDSERREGQFCYNHHVIQWSIDYRDRTAWMLNGVIKACTQPDLASECYRVLVIDLVVSSLN